MSSADQHVPKGGAHSSGAFGEQIRPQNAGRSTLAVIGLVILGVSVLASLLPPLLVPLLMRSGNFDYAVATLANLASTAGQLVMAVAALVLGLVSLRREGRPILAALVVGAAGISVVGVLVGLLATLVLNVLFLS